jgi:hypothetical protein
MKEEFVLPEKWCIRGCYNFHLWISKWDTKNKENTINVSGLDSNLFYYNLDIENTKSWDFSSIIREDYIEITFEQFQQYVLNDLNEKSKEPKTKKDYTYLIKILEKL